MDVKTIWITCVLVLVMSACKHIDTESADVSQIYFKESDGNATFADLFDVISIIPLETSDGCMLSDVMKVVAYDHRFYVYDEGAFPSLYIFNDDGMYYSRAGNYGKGHGEYSFIYDFTIDKVTGKIVVLSLKGTVIVYDLDGRYLFSKQLTDDVALRNIACNDDGYVCSTNHAGFSAGEYDLLYFFGHEFNFVTRKLNAGTRSTPPSHYVPSPLQGCNDTVYYFDFDENCFHIIKTDEGMDMHTYQVKTARPYSSEDIVKGNLEEHVLDYDIINESIYANGKIYGWMDFQNRLCHFQYTLACDSLFLTSYGLFKPTEIYYDGNDFYSVIPSDIFLSLVDDSYPEAAFRDALLESLGTDRNKVTIDSNHVIMRFKAKSKAKRNAS